MPGSSWASTARPFSRNTSETSLIAGRTTSFMKRYTSSREGKCTACDRRRFQPPERLPLPLISGAREWLRARWRCDSM